MDADLKKRLIYTAIAGVVLLGARFGYMAWERRESGRGARAAAGGRYRQSG